MEDVTFPELLDHLRNGGSALNLVGLVNLFVGQTDQDWTTKILSTLPIQTSSSLTAKNIKVVTQRSLVHIEDIKDITSISFQVGTTNPDPLLEWKFALETYSPKPPYNVALSDLTVTIEQPVSFSRTLRGTYSGLFSGHDIIGEFTPDFFQGTTVFKTTFRGSYSIVELLATFFEDKFQYSEQLSKIRVPGLEELEHSVAPSHTSSFVVETIQSKSYLMQVSSGFPFNRKALGSNWAILMNESLYVDSLRVVLSVINSPEDYQTAFELGGQLNQIPFCLSAGLSGSKTCFELAIQPEIGHEPSITELLKLTGSSTILHVASFPGISNLSDELAISNASLGWVGHDVNSLGLGFKVHDWKIDHKFEVGNLSLSIQSTSPFHDHEFFLWGSGIVEIDQVPLVVFLKVSFPFISFNISTLGRPLTLNSLFRHLEEDVVLPHGFTSILDQPSIDRTIIEGSHASGWSLSRFAMTMSIKDPLDIFKNFVLSLPSISVDITSPFNKAGREIKACIDAAITGDVNCAVSITLGKVSSVQGVDDSVQVTFRETGEEGLSLGGLIRMFDIRDWSRSYIPPNLSLLFDIGLASASATLSHRDGKYSLSDMSVSVVSSRRLLLWGSVVLENLSLDFNYPMSPGVNFSADLSFDGASDLKVDLTYDSDDQSPPPSQPPLQTPGNEPIAMTATGGASWLGKIEYDGSISVPDIIARMSDINIKGDLSSVESGLTLIPGLHNFNFELPPCIIELKYQPSRTSFAFKAKIDFLIVHSLSLECWKEQAKSWKYSLNFNLSSADFFSLVGIRDLPVSLGAAAIIISNAVDPSFPINTTVGQNGLSVALSVTLTLDSKGPLRRLRNEVGDHIDISGAFGKNFLDLYVKTGDIICDGMTLSGYMGVKYINSDLQFFMQGDVKHINIPDLSSEPFETDFTLSVEVSDLVPDPEIDLTFQLSTLENAFKCKGLNFNDILFSIGFSVDFPVPSELSACGQVQFCVGEQIFAGSIAFHFDQDSLSHCGVMGSFKTYPSLSQALTGFGSHGQNVPRNVNGTFADLSFHIAPQRFYVGNILVPQGFGLAGSLSLPSPSEFNASFDIEISPTRVHVDGHIKNALVFPTSGPRSFAVFQVSSPSKGPFIDMTITIDSFRCDLSAEVYFLGLSAGISAQISDKGVEIHEFIYAWVGGAKLDIIADKDMFSLSMSCTLALTIPHFLIGTIEFPSIEKAEFALSLGTEVNWSKATWELSITGDLSLFGWDLGRHTFILDVDFTGLEELIRRLEHKIASLFPSHFAMKILHSLEAGVKEVVVVLKSIGLAAIHIGEVLVNHFACGMGEVMKEIGDVFDMAVDDLIPIMKDLGAGLHQVVQILHDWGSDLGSVCGDAALLAKTFGLEVGDVANTVGLVFGKGIDDVRHIMTNVGVDFTNAINTGKQGVKQLLHTVGQVVYRADQVGSQVIHTVGLVGGQVAHTITNTAGQVILTVGQEGNQVVHTVEQVPGATVHTVSQVGGQVVYTVAQVGNEVAGAASGAVDQAIQVTGQAASQVVHTVSQVGNQVNHTVSQVGNDIANAEGNVINFFHPSININIPIF